MTRWVWLTVAVIGCGGDVLVELPELPEWDGPTAECDLVLDEPQPRVYGAADCNAVVELVPLPLGDWEPGQRVCMVDADELVGVVKLIGPWRPGAVEYSARGAAGCAPIAGLPTPSDGSAWWQGVR